MRNFWDWTLVRKGAATLTVVSVVTACNGSSSTANAATPSASMTTAAAQTSGGVASDGMLTSSASGMPSSTRGTASATSGTSTNTGSGAATSGGASTTSGTVLFEQPLEGGIAGNFVVPLASHSAPPKGVFTLVLWQPDKYQTRGLLVPTGWDAGSRTGFTPSDPLVAQLGFRNLAGTSTAQMEGDTVGAYINSQDLVGSTTDQKMMITPQFTFVLGSQPMPFASPRGSLHGAMDLQVPTAVGSNVYVNVGFLFEDPNGVRISMGVGIFHNGRVNSVVGGGYDTPSNTYMLNSPLGLDQHFVTRASDSAMATGTPWTGWRHFDWSISEAQFVSALQHLVATYPGKVTSTDPAAYVLAEFHLNAEFHTKGLPAQLGWSMRGLTLSTMP